MLSSCTLRLSALALASAALLTGAFAPQEKASKDKTTAPAATADDKAMMEKWKAYATPGSEHKVLEPKVGKWDVKVRMWATPDAPVQESSATCESRWVFGNRFLEHDVKGTWMGQPFEGRGFTGYDNLKKKYVTTWLDSGMTGIAFSEGTYDPAKKAFTFTGECPDVMSGKFSESRTVETMKDANTCVSETYKTGPDGKEFKTMEMVATRAKST
jgi:hypothetical protein